MRIEFNFYSASSGVIYLFWRCLERLIKDRILFSCSDYVVEFVDAIFSSTLFSIFF